MTAADAQLKGKADLDALLARSERRGILLFKHSTACPISARAFEEVSEFRRSRAGAEPAIAIVAVIEDRAVSQEVELRLGVRHESPQVIWIAGGRAAGHLSHCAITARALTSLCASTARG